MSFDWKDFLTQAEQMETEALATGATLADAKHRTSISRAYYSAFNFALEHAKSNLGYKFPYFANEKYGMHKDLVEFYKIYTPSAGDTIEYQKIGSRLGSCRSHRTEADYDKGIINKLNKKNAVTVAKSKDVLNYLGIS